MEHYYEVSVDWNKDRIGTLRSSELETKIEVATPPQFPKGAEHIWSPEHLFTAAVNSCLMTTFLSIAENSKLEFTHFHSKSLGKLEMVDGKYIMSEIILMPTLTIIYDKDIEKAQKVLQKAETACLISNSIRSNIIFKPVIKIESLVI
jgi:peroxiredoxin-like protein